MLAEGRLRSVELREKEKVGSIEVVKRASFRCAQNTLDVQFPAMVVVEGVEMWAWCLLCYSNRSKMLWGYKVSTGKVVKVKSTALEKVLLGVPEPAGAAEQWVVEESCFGGVHNNLQLHERKNLLGLCTT